ncbi:MAG TPA: DNA recombination protein RmuC, partial [Opitutales bacterium]|nr:DNA recombination protein RmuC [Opitutales bacterium]
MQALLAVSLCALCALAVVAWNLYRRLGETRTLSAALTAKADSAASDARRFELDAAMSREKLAAAESLVRGSEAELTRARQELNDKALKASELSAELAALKATAEGQRKAFEERMGELRALREELSNAFAELSRKALGENSESFLKLAGERLAKLGEQGSGELEKRRAAVEAMVKPLQETLAQVGERVEHFDKARADSFARMDEQMKALAVQEASLRRQTEALGEALRKPSVRGAWGEMQLRRVVEFAGMVDKCHFAEQVVVSASDRPDMIV